MFQLLIWVCCVGATSELVGATLVIARLASPHSWRSRGHPRVPKGTQGYPYKGSSPCALASLRRPAVSLGAGAAHEHGPLGVGEAVCLQEGRDGLLVVDDGGGACPVRAPQATIETPGIEHAGK